jgi:hypothetical protein
MLFVAGTSSVKTRMFMLSRGWEARVHPPAFTNKCPRNEQPLVPVCQVGPGR